MVSASLIVTSFILKSGRYQISVMKPLNKLLSIHNALAWILTIFAIVFRILARVYAYDESIGYFESNSLFPVLYYIFLGLIVLLSFSALISFRKVPISDTVLTKMKQVCIAERFAGILSALITLGVIGALVCIYWINPPSVLIADALTIFGLVTALFSAIFFLLLAIPTRRGKAFHVICGFSLVLHNLYMLGASYFELYTPMNSPVKVLCQLTAISAIFFLLTDLRFMLDNARSARFVFSSTLTLGFSAVSVFTGAFFSVPNESYTDFYHIFNVTNLAIFIYAAVRTVRFLTLMAHSEPVNEEPESEDTFHEMKEADSEDFTFSDEVPEEAPTNEKKEANSIDRSAEVPSEQNDDKQVTE